MFSSIFHNRAGTSTIVSFIFHTFSWYNLSPFLWQWTWATNNKTFFSGMEPKTGDEKTFHHTAMVFDLFYYFVFFLNCLRDDDNMCASFCVHWTLFRKQYICFFLHSSTTTDFFDRFDPTCVCVPKTGRKIK